MKELKMLFKRLKVEEIAVKLGVRTSTVYFWKSGKTKPSPVLQEKIKSAIKEM